MSFVNGEQVKGFVIGTVKQAVLNLIGSQYPDVDDSYKVVITRNGVKLDMMYALLQNEIQLNISSQWTSFIPFGDITKTAVATDIGLYGKGSTLQTAVMSRRVWVGSDPVSIRLDLILLADEDSDADVVRKVQCIQGLALPSEPAGSGSCLVPPGPSPFKLNPDDTINEVGGKFEGENINISVGNFLFFKNVIVQSVEVKFENRMSQINQKPTCARVSVVFETYQILTREALERVYDSSLGKLYNSVGSEFLKESVNSMQHPLQAIGKAGKFLGTLMTGGGLGGF